MVRQEPPTDRTARQRGNLRRWAGLALLALFVTVASLGAIYIRDSVLRHGQAVAFSGPEEELLSGTYYPGSQSAGILLLEGFGSDQATLRSIASEFGQAGVHVLTFDFSGHGRSPGGLAFDNAATDRLARQTLAAKEELERRSGLTSERILFLGHSMGARVGLQAATMGAEPVGGLILLGTQVNLAANVQSQLFTGVSDGELAWVQSLGAEQPPTNILLLSGRWDDILPPANARLLLQRLAGPQALEGQRYGDLDQGTGRQMYILDGLLHNYEVFSPQILIRAKAWASAVWRLDPPLPPEASLAHWRNVLWLISLAGLFLTVVGSALWAAAALPPLPPAVPCIRVLDIRRFLWAKLSLWLAAVPLILLLGALLFFLPLPVPAFNLIYVGFIGGYGLLMMLLYGLGRMPATEGRLPFARMPARQQRAGPGRPLLAVGLTGGLLALTAAYANSGWFLVPPLGNRFLWLLLFSLPTALGFWIGLHEWGMLKQAAPRRLGPRLVAALIGLTPFFLWTLFQAAIGSLSGMVAGAQGLIILGLVLAHGALVQRIVGRPWLAAVLQAVLLYWLILPQGALFST